MLYSKTLKINIRNCIIIWINVIMCFKICWETMKKLLVQVSFCLIIPIITVVLWLQIKRYNDQLTTSTESLNDLLTVTLHGDQLTAATVQSKLHSNKLRATTVQSLAHVDQMPAASVKSKTHEDKLTGTVKSRTGPPNHKLHFVTYHHSITLASQKEASSKVYDRRMEEMYVLRKNLQHPLVTNMHVITANKTLFDEAIKEEMVDDKKVIIHDNGRPPTMKEVFLDQYICGHLLNKIVVVSNGDIYLGSGFDRLNHTIMTEQRIMYTLTRHHAPESNCTEGGALCSLPYLGSHDTFVFILNDPIPSEVLDELDYQIGSPGSENRLMWVFKTKLNYCLLNPCIVLKTYHYHCSGVRTSHERINTNGKSALSYPSEKLICS